jgi:LCP family protein required for cell wall assembly
MGNDSGHGSWRRALYSFITVIVLFGALYSGYLFFSTVRALVARPSIPFIGNITNSGAIEGRAPQQDLPDIVQKKERVNILLLGIDQRPQETGPWRTDTMILVSVDPATDSASVLSIPRDLWVTIPGYGENRINTAHFLGDSERYPGGGVALAKKTIWYNFGIPVHYYVRINFTGFEKLIDAIGGLTINVEKPIHDEAYPDENYGTFVLDIPAGVQHMDGKRVLQYVRSRHGSSDFDRMARQQQVLRAALDRALSLSIPLSRIPKLIELAGDTVKTDMTLDEILALAQIVQRMDSSRVRSGIIDSSMTTSKMTPQGWLVEVPDWDKIRPLLDELFPIAVASAAPTPSLAQWQILDEKSRIELLNGTSVPELAQTTAERLREKGFNVVRYGAAERLDYPQTIIIAYGQKPYTLQALAAELHVPAENIRQEPGNGGELDMRIILGQDYVARSASQP